MKGQHRIVMEIMLFSIGIAITGFVVINFQDLRESADELSIKDQLNTVLNDVINSVIKSSLTYNSSLRIDIPYTVSGHSYKIYVNNGNLIAADMKDRSLSVTRKIFNIDEPNNNIQGEVYSGAGIVEITNTNGKIIIQRG
jgi:hypothetical protein